MNDKFEGADAQTGTRRRTRLLAGGVTGGAVAVAMFGAGSAAFAGGAPHGTGSGSDAAPVAKSQAAAATTLTPKTAPASDSQAQTQAQTRHVASGTTIQIVKGMSIKVTDTAVSEQQADFPAVVKDVASANMRWTGSTPEIALQLDSVGSQQVLVGEYQGSQIPAHIEIARDGKQYPATLVSTPGMKNWTPLYAVLPPSNADLKFTAYDAHGKVIYTQTVSAGPKSAPNHR